MNNHDDVLEEAARWLDDGRRVALATVVETWGSAPRPVGSQLAIRDDAAFVGSVSGGCIEGDVVTRALETLETGRTELLEYGVSDTMAWEVGLACGGRIRVLVEPVKD
jgi:xanthine/CO dehydrogenase XdhC/CoxF family maturation factor